MTAQAHHPHKGHRNRRHSRRGTVLIVAMIVTFALAGTVLVLCRSMRVEVMAAGNVAASAQASAVARGAEQYVVALIRDEGQRVRDLGEENFAGVRIGEGMFWILRPVYEDDPDLPLFGLVEESAKVNLNRENFDQISLIPGMTYEGASAIMDWIDADHNVERDGAEMDFYLNNTGRSEPYYPKNGRLETVEELLMIRGIDRLMLYGDGTAVTPLGQRANAGIGSSSGGAYLNRQIARGFFDLVTVYSRENNTTADGQQRINIANNNREMRRRLQQRLRNRLPEARADEIVVAIGTDDIRDIFEFYRRANLKPDEFDQIADDLATSGSRSIRGLININTAPRAVLNCLTGLEQGEVDKLLGRRRTVDTSAEANTGIAWVAEALGVERAAEARIGSQITSRANQWSADILAVSGNGRAFKRVRIVVDSRQDPANPSIIYRRDLTHRGWPMDPSILASIRAGAFSSQLSPFSLASSQQPGGRF